MKTDIFNLIILDESGSMYDMTQHTINGCNETINTIRTAQETYAEMQNHYVSIYAFQSGSHIPSRYLIKNQPIAEVSHINGKMYRPNGMTPLYDAVGSTLVDLKTIVKECELAIGSVTIITDGYENASRHYTHEKVARMIADLKEQGWKFNFIGANIDVDRTAASLNIDNALMFRQDEKGTREMFARENRGRREYYERLNEYERQMMPCKEELKTEKGKRGFFQMLKMADKGFFKEEEDEEEGDE